jgi:hypothetical protein
VRSQFDNHEAEHLSHLFTLISFYGEKRNPPEFKHSRGKKLTSRILACIRFCKVTISRERDEWLAETVSSSLQLAQNICGLHSLSAHE